MQLKYKNIKIQDSNHLFDDAFTQDVLSAKLTLTATECGYDVCIHAAADGRCFVELDGMIVYMWYHLHSRPTTLIGVLLWAWRGLATIPAVDFDLEFQWVQHKEYAEASRFKPELV